MLHPPNVHHIGLGRVLGGTCHLVVATSVLLTLPNGYQSAIILWWLPVWCYQILFGHPWGDHLAVAKGHIKPSVTIVAVTGCVPVWERLNKCVDFEFDFEQIPLLAHVYASYAKLLAGVKLDWR